jgi:hypothetical protein
MRYADGGGLTAQGRARREDVRLQTARLFEQGVDADQIAKTLRVSTKSVYLVTAMRHRLHRIQRQHSLITGFLGQTGLALEPEPP